MNVKKFSAPTSREAWRMVRDTLGPDAAILSNRTVNGVVEILALASEDMASLAEPSADQENVSKSTLASLAPKQRVAPDRVASDRTEPDQASNLSGALEAARIAAIE